MNLEEMGMASKSATSGSILKMAGCALLPPEAYLLVSKNHVHPLRATAGSGGAPAAGS
jgi:hypothetical protein